MNVDAFFPILICGAVCFGRWMNIQAPNGK